MKKKLNILLPVIALLAFLTLAPSDAFSQKRGGGPPPWAPAHGYRAKARHIYFPDHNFYYDLDRGVYIYINNGGWQIAARLPDIFGGPDLAAATQIELDFRGDNPQKDNKEHLIKYKVKKKGSGKHDNGHGKGKGKGKGKG